MLSRVRLGSLEVAYGIFVVTMVRSLVWGLSYIVPMGHMENLTVLSTLAHVSVFGVLFVLVGVVGMVNFIMWRSKILCLICAFLGTLRETLFTIYWYLIYGPHDRVFITAAHAILAAYCLYRINIAILKQNHEERMNGRD